MMHRLAVVIVCVAVAPFAVLAQRTPPSNDASLAALLEPIRAKYGFPALGGAIVTRDGLDTMAVTGVRKAGTKIAVAPDDLWHLGSDTKAMTAVVIGKLVERRQLTWETTIESALPAEAARAPLAFHRITLLQLLSHRAGLVRNIDWPRAAKAPGSPRAQRLAAMKTIAATGLSSAPGTKYEYSNLGYVVAATMAEAVANRSWEDMIREVVFDPLGMTSAGFGGTGTPGHVDQPWPHDAGGKPKPRNGPDVDNPPVMGPAGSVHCSLADWAKFVADQLRGLNGQPGVLAAETSRMMHTPPFGGDYAFGWLVTQRPWGGGTVYTHNGSNTMNVAVAWLAPARNFAVLVVTNEGGDAAMKGTDEAVYAMIVRRASATEGRVLRALLLTFDTSPWSPIDRR